MPKAKIAPEAVALLNIVRLCEKYHTLPNSGGLLDQDGFFVDILHQVGMWDEQRAELDRRKSNAV